jgi:hypothetical protein
MGAWIELKEKKPKDGKIVQMKVVEGNITAHIQYLCIVKDVFMDHHGFRVDVKPTHWYSHD